MNVAPVLAALGDESRLHIVRRLSASGPLSIARLTEGTTITRQAITKHLVMLNDVGLVRSARQGRERIWELEPKRITEVMHYLEKISRQWDAAIIRLKALVED